MNQTAGATAAPTGPQPAARCEVRVPNYRNSTINNLTFFPFNCLYVVKTSCVPLETKPSCLYVNTIFNYIYITLYNYIYIYIYIFIYIYTMIQMQMYKKGTLSKMLIKSQESIAGLQTNLLSPLGLWWSKVDWSVVSKTHKGSQFVCFLI